MPWILYPGYDSFHLFVPRFIIAPAGNKQVCLLNKV